jgi:hypothetical protein
LELTGLLDRLDVQGMPGELPRPGDRGTRPPG